MKPSSNESRFDSFLLAVSFNVLFAVIRNKIIAFTGLFCHQGDFCNTRIRACNLGLWGIVWSFVLLITGCSVRNEAAKNDSFFKDLSTKYNLIYNANHILETEEKRQFESAFSSFIKEPEVFFVAQPTDDALVLLDSVIDKANLVIHGNADNKYLWDAYTLLAKAYFLKGFYHQADELFVHAVQQESISIEKRAEAYAWLSRIYTHRKDSLRTNAMADSAWIYMDQKVDRKTKSLIAASKANSVLQQKNADTKIAADLLKQAIKFSADRHQKTRWYYLLGELNKRLGEVDEAQYYFQKVIRKDVSDALTFEAAMQLAGLYQVYYEDVEQSVKPYQQLLKQARYGQFSDRIYYQISKIYSDWKQEDRAIENLHRSLSAGDTDPIQRTKSYLLLSDIYHEKRNYSKAGKYIDSAVLSMPLDFPDLNAVRTELRFKREINERFRQIAACDTLLYLAGLTPQERDSAVSKHIIQSTTLPIASEESFGRNLDIVRSQRYNTDIDHETFYFNNADAVELGKRDFKWRWGDRKLADNWRNSPVRGEVTANKGECISSHIEDNDTAQIAQDITYYLSRVPVTDAQKKDLNDAVGQHLLFMADMYRELLLDLKKATETYLIFVNRFADSPELPYIYYVLFKMNGDEVYQEKLLREFPNTIYAKLATGPNYENEITAYKRRADAMYSEVYHLLGEEHYEEVLQRSDMWLAQYRDLNTLVPQILYLQSLAIGYLKPVEHFQKSLLELVDTYPSDSLVTPLAKQHLLFIKNNAELFEGRAVTLQQRISGATEHPILTPWPTEEYPVQILDQNLGRSLDEGDGSTLLQEDKNVGMLIDENKRLFPKGQYYVVVAVGNNVADLASSRYGIGQFNRSNFARHGYVHQLRYLDKRHQLIMVGDFKDIAQAKYYKLKIKPLLSQIMKIPPEKYGIFVIEKEMSKTLINKEAVQEYQRSYNEAQSED